MELPASYVLALAADQARMNSARLDGPTLAPRRRRIRTALKRLSALSALAGFSRLGHADPAPTATRPACQH